MSGEYSYLLQEIFQITNNNLKFKAMRTLLWFILVIILIGWVLGAFVWAAGGLIHLLLVVAVIILLFNLISGRRL